MNTPLPEVRWERTDYSRIPFWLYSDEAIYRAEQERVFRGPVWCFVGLEAEIPAVGDFRTAALGDTQVIYNRGEDGAVHVLVNRCGHRGSIVRREIHGNVREHSCIYHRWTYALDGTLTALPFERGLRGKGGMDPTFSREEHGLRALRVATYRGVIFASFHDRPEPLEEYLGAPVCGQFDKMFGKPIRILGYQRQIIYGNWKGYYENLGDTYHGSLLHDFQSAFGISRVTQQGGIEMDPRHRNTLIWTISGSDDDEEFKRLYKENRVHDSSLRLHDTSLIEHHREFDDGVSLLISSVFPNACFQLISNSLATRQVRTVGPNEFELFWTYYGFVDDTPDLARKRLLQANLVGPAGLISMEDGEAVEIAHRGTHGGGDAGSVIEMGGRGAIPDSIPHRITDVPVRGFWSYYAELMGFAPEGAVR